MTIQMRRVRYGDPDFLWFKQEEFRLFGLANGFTEAGDRDAGEMLVYSRFESHSEFFVAANASDGETVALIRFIRFKPERGMDSFSTLVDARAYGQPPRCYLSEEALVLVGTWNLQQVAELATQTVVHAYRAHGVLERLWLYAHDTLREEGVRIWTFALTLLLYSHYRHLIMDGIAPLGDVMPNYVGADSVPGYVLLDHPDAESYLDLLRKR